MHLKTDDDHSAMNESEAKPINDHNNDGRKNNESKWTTPFVAAYAILTVFSIVYFLMEVSDDDTILSAEQYHESCVPYGYMSDECDGMRVRFSKVNAINFDKDDEIFQITLPFHAEGRYFVYPRDFQYFESDHLKSVTVQGRLNIQPTFCLGECAYVENAEVIYERRSDDEIVAIEERKRREAERERVENRATAECVTLASRTIPGDLDCGWFLDPVISDTEDGTYISLTCDGTNVFGGPKRYYVRCLHRNGGTMIDLIQ